MITRTFKIAKVNAFFLDGREVKEKEMKVKFSIRQDSLIREAKKQDKRIFDVEVMGYDSITYTMNDDTFVQYATIKED